MSRLNRSKLVLMVMLLTGGACALVGCGTTRSTDTARTATEQLLISDAIDRAVQSVHFGVLAGQTVYLDDSEMGDVVDREYLVSTLRQHLLASGCILRNRRDEADFVVEARVGAIGTDRNDLLFGIPATNVPQILPLQGVPSAIPEVPLAKRRDQRGIAKIAVFAYHRATGNPVWQSGIAHTESSSNDVWILGAGPFQRGTIYDGTEFAGKPLRDEEVAEGPARSKVGLAQEMTFTSPDRIAKEPPRLPEAAKSAVLPASHEEQSAAAPKTNGIAPPSPAQEQARPRVPPTSAVLRKPRQIETPADADRLPPPPVSTTPVSPVSDAPNATLPRPQFGLP